LSGGQIISKEQIDFLVWGMPLECAVQVEHCALRAASVWTVAPSASAAESAPALNAKADRLRAAVLASLDD